MVLPIAHIAISIALIVLILLQERSAGLSGIFGRDNSTFYHARRGMEKAVLWGTIVLICLFAALAIAQLVVPIT